MSELVEFLRARLDEQEARGDAMAFPPPGYKPDPSDTELGLWLTEDAQAKRRILHEHRDDGYGDCLGCGMNALEEMRYAVDECPTKRFLALPYDRHPDYQEEWRP